MAKYSICVVDDSREDAQECIKFLEKIDEIGDIHLIVDPFEVLGFVKTTKIDILFMDIEMPGATGLEIYHAIPPIQRPVLVLVTNHEKFALDGFRANAADYVIKPVNFASIANAFTRSLTLLNITVTILNIPEREYAFFNLKGGGMQALKFRDIICVEGDGNYTIAHLRGNIKITIRKSMREMANDLPASYFLRIHQSYIVNMRFAGKLETRGLYVNELAEHSPLPVSRSYRASIVAETRK